MERNKKILQSCPNFYKIINFDFYEEDYITKKLIEIYKEYIFRVNIDNKEELELINQIDLILNKYIDDYYFRNEMKLSLKEIRVKEDSDVLKEIIKSILKCFSLYEEGYTRNIYISRWI